MRRLLVVVLMLGLAGSAMAANLGSVPGEKPAGVIYEGGGRTGGDTIGDATAIATLPYYDGGNTSGFANDYDEICPYSGSTSPDVVYSYAPGANEFVTIDLCASSYDTKVYVYQNAQGNLVACNDDAGCGYSGFQSKLANISLLGGNTYYIVVDGYGGSNGEYSLAITPYVPCEVICPAGAQIEGEPPCVDNYYDEYDGGCNSTGWVSIPEQGGGCADLCGKSCTYLYQGLSYRDTDWYSAIAAGGNVDADVTAAFPVQFILIYGTNCANLQYTLLTGGECDLVSLSWYVAPGAEVWLWVGAQVFTGVPESDYHLHVCGLQQDVPTEVTTWGQIKNQDW